MYGLQQSSVKAYILAGQHVELPANSKSYQLILLDKS